VKTAVTADFWPSSHLQINFSWVPTHSSAEAGSPLAADDFFLDIARSERERYREPRTVSRRVFLWTSPSPETKRCRGTGIMPSHSTMAAPTRARGATARSMGRARTPGLPGTAARARGATARCMGTARSSGLKGPATRARIATTRGMGTARTPWPTEIATRARGMRAPCTGRAPSPARRGGRSPAPSRNNGRWRAC